jgi:2-oxoisovalerate dehydrogenase E2 component (dihydrolipoyl transacylase)
MSIFNLPDLGEGLPDAEIHQWYVKVGDEVTTDQPLVALETAKAVVDVPAPQAGTIVKLYGEVGDIIQTGHPLVEFAGAQSATQSDTADKPREDQGTVVGSIEATGQTVKEQFIIGRQAATAGKVKATPAVRALAKKLDVDLGQVTPTGANGAITQQDVQQIATSKTSAPAGFTPLKGTRRTMAALMSDSHRRVVPVTIYDDAILPIDINGSDITVNIIQALVTACRQEPALNAWYDDASNSRQLHENVHLGLAVDSEDGLFVPVIAQAEQLTTTQLRQEIDRLKQQVADRSLAPERLQGATITLSNFGKFAGRYANPVIVPPAVAIMGVGRLQQAVVAIERQPAIRYTLPLSLTFDHRAITGGEATRFLGIIIQELARLFAA